jgi:hypothetical protein
MAVSSETKKAERRTRKVLDASSNRTASVLEALDRHRVRAVALNRAPEFSGAPPLDLAAALVRRFPHAMVIGKFEVRWIE